MKRENLGGMRTYYSGFHIRFLSGTSKFIIQTNFQRLMESRSQNTFFRRDEDTLEHFLNIRSEHLDGRPLTSTGRQRVNLTDLEDSSEDEGTHSNHQGNNNNEDDDNGVPVIFFRVILHSNAEEEVSQGLPKEMLEKIKRMKMGRSGKDCSICYNGFKPGEKIRKLPCKHIFHDSCIVPWLETNITCPNCRFNLYEYFLENPEGNYT